MKPNFVAFGTLVGLLALGLAPAGLAKESKAHPKHVEFSFEGPLGAFDRGALQRGFQVYKQVCAACHSMSLLTYRNLGEKGGPFECLPGAEPEASAEGETAGHGKGHARPNCPATPNDNPVVKAIAAEVSITDLDENGDSIDRPGRPSDRFRAPFENEQRARAANGGALPPDLSLIVRARHGGASYIYSLLLGYGENPPGLNVPAGKYYNPWFPGDVSSIWSGDAKAVPEGGLIAMAPQLETASQIVEFGDGTPATPEQIARDVATFLAWASEPKVESRKRTGVVVMIYLFLLAGLLFVAYKAVWRNQSH